jgi:hypothetical protein
MIYHFNFTTLYNYSLSLSKSSGVIVSTNSNNSKFETTMTMPYIVVLIYQFISVGVTHNLNSAKNDIFTHYSSAMVTRLSR